jgi:hypothetical protein
MEQISRESANSQEEKEAAILKLLSLDLQGIQRRGLIQVLGSIEGVFKKLNVSIDAKDSQSNYKFLDALKKANINIRNHIADSLNIKNSAFITELTSSLVKSDKESLNYERNKKLALNLIIKGAAQEGTEKDLLNNIELTYIQEAINDAMNGSKNGQKFSIAEDQFKHLRDVFFERVEEKAKSQLFKEAIDKSYRNEDLVIDMALSGYKLDKEQIYTFNNSANNESSRLGKEILDNKGFFTEKELTENDAKRVALLASAVFENDNERKKFIKNNLGISPLKLAIDTKQLDLAIEMIKKGELLKPSELSIGMRFKNAIRFINKDDIKKVSEEKLSFQKKLHQQRKDKETENYRQYIILYIKKI